MANSAPVITSASSTNFTAGTTGVVYQAAGTDLELTTLAWSLGGTDAARFTIDAATGEVRFRQVPDFATPVDAGHDNTYDIVVSASDGALATDKAVAVAVTAGTNLVNTLGGAKGFGETSFGPSDDGSTARIDLTSVFGAGGVNFFGTAYTGLYINNNGSVTFGAPMASFSPTAITGATSNPLIAPFWQDVDTRYITAPTATEGGNSTGSDLVWYDLDTVGHSFTVTWDDVGYFNRKSNLLNAFQMTLTQADSAGGFDITFRYEDIRWATSDFAPPPARAGFSAGNGVNFFELLQSGDLSAMLALESASNVGIPGTFSFSVRSGSGAADTLLGSSGGDVISAGDGDDSAAGGLGNDQLDGGGGDDALNGGVGDDSVFGGLGNDVVRGGAGNDKLLGQDDNDLMIGDAGDDSLSGGTGADTLSGATGNDSLDGGADADNLTGGAGRDSLVGGLGLDTLRGGDDQDTLSGGDGDDLLIGDGGDDILDGGTGADLLSGGLGEDSVLGGDGADTLRGGDGNDTLLGDAGADFLAGDDGADSLLGGAAADTLSGVLGADTLDGGDGNDMADGGAGNDLLMGGNGADTMRGAENNDTLQGGAGTDNLRGDAGDDLLSGGADDDFLGGADGADTLQGDAGADVLRGGPGNDMMDGGEGHDVMTGSTGADCFRFTDIAHSAVGVLRDEVSDFLRAEGDWLDLGAIDADTGVDGDQAFALIGASAFTGVAGQLRFATGILFGDVTGDGLADFEIALTGLGGLSAADLVL